MSRVESEISQSLADYIATGDDQIASKLGTITLHEARPRLSTADVVACVGGAEYDVEIIVRRRV